MQRVVLLTVVQAIMMLAFYNNTIITTWRQFSSADIATAGQRDTCPAAETLLDGLSTGMLCGRSVCRSIPGLWLKNGRSYKIQFWPSIV